MLRALFTFGLFVAAIGRSGRPDKPAVTLPEPAFYRSLSEAAARHGIDLYVFSPDDYEAASGELYGYRCHSGNWVRRRVPFPDIVYDRCYYSSGEQRRRCMAVLQAIKERKPHRRLSGHLPSKWEIYGTLSAYPRIAELLPPTARFDKADLVEQRLGGSGDGLFLKPAAGMQGKGALLLRGAEDTGQIRVDGRTRDNRPFALLFNDRESWKRWLTRFIGGTPYIIQPCLNLSLPDGRPFDIRVLMQKDGQGKWALTGTAARCGLSGSITSNLHGGGTARDARGLLAEGYGGKKGEEILAQMHTMSEYIAQRLENRYGRFAELGFDYGVAEGGRLWLLEVNSKPGRTAFALLNDKQAAEQSLERPLLYAKLLNNRQAPPFITRPSAEGRSRTISSPPIARRPSAR